MQIDRFRAMNSDIVLVAEGAPSQVHSGFVAVHEFIEASEKRFTRFSEQSELSQLNRAAGSWFRSSPDFFEVMKEALYCFHKTHGLFDPSVLPSLWNAGYVHSLDEIRRTGSTPPSASPLQASTSTFASVELNETDSAIRLPADMQIDLGGIAKGWIAERAAHVLRRYASACAVNAGGDMFLSGYPDGQDSWEVGLEDPRDPDVDISILYVQEGAIATSSVLKRAWKQGERSRHHLIDPRTGEPASTSWLSVTVLAPRAAVAETFAKAFLIADEEETPLLGEQNPDLTALAVDKNGNLVSLVKSGEGLHVSR
ncbi:MAG TPA: FAD:protein FMN transferase [Anaerolineales bacterium]|nr:FAD:protein FMN transferase [Anaerolineales bacterium]